jgi:F0F1-type ATP synthase assembly protein I
VGLPNDQRKPSIGDSRQDGASSVGSAAAASYTLVGAVLLLGGLGYGLDSWAGSSPWGLAGGLVLGMVVGFYELIKYSSRKS